MPSYLLEMARRLRFIPEGSLVEVAARTVQGRFLLKLGPGWTKTFVGILARAQELFPVRIHAFVCLSNHLHLLTSPDDAQQLAGFMGHVLTNLSKEAGRRHGWRGPAGKGGRHLFLTYSSGPCAAGDGPPTHTSS